MFTSSTTSFYTKQFWLLTISSFLFFASFNMLIPELPRYLTNMGGSDYKGYIIALFTLTAGLSRPFSGRLTDHWGRVPVMAIGSLVCVVCGLLYPLLTTIYPFLALRLLHGFSTGFKPTATAAYIADVVPASNRGEALGLHGLCASIGSAISPALGSWIAQTFSMDVLFYTSSLFSLLSIAILLNMRETLPQKGKLSWNAIAVSKSDWFDKAVIAPSLIIFLTYFSFGAVATLTPDFSDRLGFKNLGLYLLVATFASLASRLFAGKASDRYGRIQGAMAGSAILVIGMLITAFAKDATLFLIGGIVYGVSMGILSPVLSAWTVDLSTDVTRGKALSTMYLSMEAGIGLGAWVSALIYSNNYKNLQTAFELNAFLGALALVYGWFVYRSKYASKPIG